MSPDTTTKLRTLCASIAERTGPDGHPDVLTLLAAMSDTLDAVERLNRELTQICILAAKRADHVVLQGEALDKAIAQIDQGKVAARRLCARIIANAHLLDTPFTDAPDLSPWLLIKRDMAALYAALGIKLAVNGTEGGSGGE